VPKRKPSEKPAEAFYKLNCYAPASAGFLLGSLFYPEDGGDMFTRNNGFSPNYTVL
jgi:hypothetical protein